MTNTTMLSFLPFSANAQQVTILNAIEQFLSNQDDFLVLKGAAGTGKTSIMKAVVDFLGSQEKSVQLLAPMGRSAKAISNKTQTTAKTVHSCIYKPLTDTENAVVNLIRRVNDITQKQVFIIDESSMLSNKLTDNEDFVSQKPLLTDLIDFIKQGNSLNKIIFVGDDCQLAPVGYKSDEKSPALNVQYLEKTFAIHGKEVALSQVMRQGEGSAIYQTANEIRQNIYGNRAVMPNYIGNYFKGEDEAVKLYLNRFELGIQDKVVIIGCSNAYAEKCNVLIRRSLDLTGALSVGDTVMLNQNYMGQRYVASGEIGVVKSINGDIRKVADLDFLDAEIIFTDEKNHEMVQKNGTLFCIKNAENGSKENQENTLTL